MKFCLSGGYSILSSPLFHVLFEWTIMKKLFADDDEFKRWKKEWRSPVVAMPGEKSAPQLQESMQVLILPTFY
jgi:hypothetical protein